MYDLTAMCVALAKILAGKLTVDNQMLMLQATSNTSDLADLTAVSIHMHRYTQAAC
jgi:hypothetical protein